MSSTHFQWDRTTADSNYRKHGVLFEDAQIAIEDPLGATRHHVDHDRTEERWITLGEAHGTLLYLVYTLAELHDQTIWARVISARHPTPDEWRQYESGKYRIEEDVMFDRSNPDQWKRGRFDRDGMAFTGPVHVKSDVIARLSQLAKQRGTSPSALAEELLRRALDEETMKGAAETTKAQTLA
jgi:uncharacterized protein